MISMQNIIAVARYERKILFRSWFFRIFAILTLVILGFFHGVSIFERSPFSWNLKALPSALVYNGMMMFNIVQSIIAIFLASDFMKRDKKLDTAEVLFIRPMSNGDYVIGKTWGIVSLFAYLNLALMALLVIFTFASGEIGFDFRPYCYYFFLLSLPSLIFILGLSFFLMSILKNQAITFLILLAYIAAILFFLADEAWFMFDYLAFKRPMIYSSVIGFSDFWSLFSHRMMYLLAGLGFIVASILLLKRLEQSRLAPILATILMVILFAGSFTMGWNYLSPLLARKSARTEMSRLSIKYSSVPVVSVLDHAIEIDHRSKLMLKSRMRIKNETAQPVSELVFSLNPGLAVESATFNSDPVQSIQEKQILRFQLPAPMMPGAKANLEINYGGTIDQSVAYLDATDEKYQAFSTNVTMRVDQLYAVQRPDYLLLTPEVIWYPVAGVRYDPGRPAVFRHQFSNFELKVKTREHLVALSQGRRDSLAPGEYSFKIRDPLPQISLVIGQYETRSTKLGNINVNLSYLKGHNYFDKYLKDSADTLSSLITTFLDDYERPINMYYPYPDFSLVEVPVQFKALQHSWTSTLENSQPQIVMLPEKGYGIRQADFKSNLHWMKRRNEQNNEGKTEAELQASVILSFLQNVLGAENADVNFFGQNSSSDEATPPNPYSIYPNYYYYINFISSEAYPVLNYAFESYLRKTTDDPRQMFMSMARGIGDAEKANILLDGKSLKEIIANQNDPVALTRVLKAKGGYLLSFIQKHMTDQDFDKFLLDYLYNNSYREIPFDEFSGQISQRFGVDLTQFIEKWYNTNTIPAYKVSNVELVQTIDNNQVVYLVKAIVDNQAAVDGLIKFSFRTGGGSRGGFNPFGGGSNTETDERIFLIGANETREYQMMLLEQPRGITFNGMISKNIPVNMNFFMRNATENNSLKAESYERIIQRPAKNEQGIWIVDNEDPGFSVFDPANNNPIKKFFKKEETERTYLGMEFGSPPAKWSLTANSDFYGQYICSAMFVKSGTGTKTATWQTLLGEKGYFDVYVHLNRERSRRRFGGGPGGPGGPGGDRGNNEPVGSYFYTIYHDDGVEEVELKLKDVNTGWNMLGSFYLSADTAKVVLSDRSEASRVVADAVRWVKEGTRLEN